MKTTKTTIESINARIAKGEPVYLLDVCETDAAYMVVGAKTFVKYPGETPFQIKTSEKSATNAMLCGQEITEEQFNSF